MSDDLAIATVTATLKRILEKYAGTGVPQFKVKIQPPGTITDQDNTHNNVLNLFLYRVTPNNGYGNLDLPTRSSRNGELVQRSLLGLDLHYLLTAFGAGNNELAAHRMLASAMRVLHENPVLTQKIINDTLVEDPDTDYTPPSEILGSDLGFQVDLVKLTQQSLSLEEITKIWSIFFQTYYRISVAYLATVVLIDGKKSPKPTFPVLERVLHVVPFQYPVIEKIEPQILESADDAKITIIGQNLSSGDSIDIKFDNLPDEDTPQPDMVSDDRVIIAVPSKLTAGIKTAQVVHRLKLHPETDPYKVYKSNIVAFVLAPKITQMPASVKRGSELQINLRPTVAAGQRVEFLIGDFTLRYRWPVPPEPTAQPVEKISLEIPDDLPIGEHLIRISIDRAQSLLQVVDGKFVGPTIEVEPGP